MFCHLARLAYILVEDRLIRLYGLNGLFGLKGLFGVNGDLYCAWVC
jgi:hypothetical protein